MLKLVRKWATADFYYYVALDVATGRGHIHSRNTQLYWQASRPVY